MDAVFDISSVGIVQEVRDKVTGLEVALTRLAVQHEHVLTTINRIEIELRTQREVSVEYREELLQSVRATEREVENVKREIERGKEKGLVNWIRKNAPVVTIVLAVLTLLWAAGRWLVVHYR